MRAPALEWTRRILTAGRLALTAGAVCSIPLTGGAAPPGTARPQREDFVPRAGYRRTVEVLALRRQLAARVSNSAPGPVTALSGERSIPTILVEFANKQGSFTPQQYRQQLFGTGAGAKTISRYYEDMSLGRFLVDGHVIGWYRLPNDDTHYEGANNGDGPGFGELLEIGLTKADADVDFGRFDNDGPDGLPNSGDDDGVVDTVFFVHPEFGNECGNGGGNIHSHSWHYSEPSYGHSAPFKTDDLRRDRDGNPVLGEPTRILVEDYTVQPGLACPDPANPADAMTPIGVFTHEYGHALGLPDLYDRTPNGNPNSYGIGRWGLMAGGSWGFDGRPDTPTRMEPWSLARLGWADLRLLNASSTQPLTLEPSPMHNQFYVVDVTGTGGKEYFLIEYKDHAWSDLAGKRVNWDHRIPESGLAVWHIDERVGAASPTWPFAPYGQGQNDDPSIPGQTKHSLVSFEQADCKQHLEQLTNPGDSHDLWEDGTAYGLDGCDRVALAYGGAATGIKIRNIDLASGRADFGGGPSLVANQPSEAAPQPPSAAVPAVPAAPSPASSPAVPSVSAVGRPVARAPEIGGIPPAAAIATSTRDKLARLGGRSRPDLAEVLSPSELAQVRSAPEVVIEATLPPDDKYTVQSWRAAQRRVVITADTAPRKPIEEELVKVREVSVGQVSVNAQLDPSETRIERVTGLKLPAQEGSPAQDAKRRLDTTLKPLVGENVVLQAAGAAGDTTQQFQQMHRVAEGRMLPIWSKQAVLYYDGDANLTALTANTIDPASLNVAGGDAQLGTAAAKAVATDQLGLPEQRGTALVDLGERVYLVDGDPERARVVRALQLPLSTDETAGQKGVVIFVDEVSKTVLGIE